MKLAQVTITLDDGTELETELAELFKTGMKSSQDEPEDGTFIECLIIAINGIKYALKPRQLALEPATKAQ